jgi:hypothetical protein
MPHEQHDELNVHLAERKVTELRAMKSVSRVSKPARERRSRARFPITLPIQYRCRRFHEPRVGCGRSVNISSRGMLFTAEHKFAPGDRLELILEWPIAGVDLQLYVVGKVVRANGYQVGLRIDRYKFRMSPHKDAEVWSPWESRKENAENESVSVTSVAFPFQGLPEKEI